MNDPILHLTLCLADGASTERMLKEPAKEYLRTIGKPTDEPYLYTARTNRGKIFFPNVPEMYVSASHSGNYFVCGFSSVPLGIDIQECTNLHRETPQETLNRQRKLARRFFHPEEAKLVEEDPQSCFFGIWTAKESFVKFTGQGIDEHFSLFSVLPSEKISPALFQQECQWQAQAGFFHFAPLPAGYGFCTFTPCPCRWEWSRESRELLQKNRG